MVASGALRRDPVVTAQLHAALRFAVGTTATFVLCEYMQWTPTYLAPLLLAVLITMLPGPLPLKAGIMLVVVMVASALSAFLVSTLLHNAPTIMFGVIALIIFLAMGALAHRKAQLPATLLLICMVTIPVIAMLSPANADDLPRAMVRGMAIAIVGIWCVYNLWPTVLPRPAPPAPSQMDFPVKMALAGTLILVPVMLAFLLFGWASELAILINMTVLVISFDPEEGAKLGLLRTVSVVTGGFVGLLAFMTLSIMPSLVTVALITFIIGLAYATRMAKGGALGYFAVMAFNTALLIFGQAIGSPGDSSGIWLKRLILFLIGCLYAVAMMSLFWPRPRRAPKPA